MACCSTEKKPAKVTVTFPDKTTKTYGSRPEAVAAMARAGGGTMKV